MAEDGAQISKLSLVVASGTYEKVHYAFVMATGAAAIGIPVTMFFTMGACRAVLDGAGWHELPSELEGMRSRDRDEDFGEKGVATLDELIESAAELGITFMVCEMGLRAESLEDRHPRPGLDLARTGVVTFLNDAEPDGSIVYI
ncbi:MAG: DsrE/DsrF/DrsH-like family protein [Rhodospirillales bacterium]|nr:DsrE/DsrF/DrsH-like family protein [Rhodospirillales bacterium]MBO6788541.1 DsrE/DsrF/DrsH-like family protein [Rhodospirillales bacterium]